MSAADTQDGRAGADVQHASIEYRISEIEHDYPDTVHVLKDPYLLSNLARLCSPETFQPEVHQLITQIYTNMVGIVCNRECPRVYREIPTRMVEATPAGVYRGEVLDPSARAVVVDIARAGTVPAQICYIALNYILDPKQVRQDHINMNRETDDGGQVTGVAVGGSKIGGDIEGALVLFPDPMGATGGSLCRAIDIYKKKVEGAPRKLIALHLIVTPEYVRRVTETHPDVEIFAVRLDRGLSSPEVLASRPGSRWDEEKGLNAHQYIVPGGGGFGEVLNNSWV